METGNVAKENEREDGKDESRRERKISLRKRNVLKSFTASLFLWL